MRKVDRSTVHSPIRKVVRPVFGEGGAYIFTNAEAAALVARFTTQPTNARKALIDTFVGSLKTAGVWSKLDALYVTAQFDAQAAQRNWIADQYNLTPANAPTFTADRGYAGNGTSAHLTTGALRNAMSKFTQDSASIGAWERSEVAAGFLVGTATGAIARIQGRVGGLAGGRLNSTSNERISESAAQWRADQP
jgi:hypothetical protein